MPSASLNNMTVPLASDQSASSQGLLMPKLKYRFRVSFENFGPQGATPVTELTKQVVRRCSIPIVAAGAIMDGVDIANALRSGAIAAQLGTAFLCCEESGATPAHKEYLLKHHSRGSVFTTGFSGRPARGINNEFIRLMESKIVLPFPIQNTLTASLRQLGVKTNNGEYQSLWAGQDYARTRNLSTKNLMLALKEELLIALG